ncbi:hypothetical protein [Arthrobacter glacialis]|uniref:HEAT repeat domain-containing protein n=1 Tax=Arthrobacter glacialis TaxID=1664 RepID=A0A2S4A0P0_ARTGL|nr:hypothetical protein [Arthrobacter glacialis]POH74772.1 hypothetical protein CVS27_02550 [Arthrobacter glacialis]
MNLTMEDVLRALDPDEVDYAAASQLGPDALPFLMTLVQGQDPGLAAKAAYLAAVVEGELSERVVTAAAASGDVRVRVAAAHAASMLAAEPASRVLGTLLLDSDAGVQKLALKSVSAGLSPDLMVKVQEVSVNGSSQGLRDYAVQAMERLQ